MKLGAAGGGAGLRKWSVSARMYWRTTRKPQAGENLSKAWALWSKEAQEAALPSVFSAAAWNPEFLGLSESVRWADAVTYGATTKAFSCFALRWPPLVGGRELLSFFFSFLPLPFSRICHLIACFDFFQKSSFPGLFFTLCWLVVVWYLGHVYKNQVLKLRNALDHLISKYQYRWTFIICQIITITPSPRLVFLFCSL